jgi:protein-S-isoprenylcysteine O-methyltransferase Ste14
VRILLIFLWVLGVIYATIPAFWMAVHPFASYWRTRKRPFPILGLIWIAIILAVVFLTKPWHEQRFYVNPWAGIPAAILFAFAILIYRSTGRSFGRDNLIGRTELEPQAREQKLITTGIHARVRHPIYLGHLLMLTSWTIGSGLKVLFALLAFAVVTGAIMVRMEDAELEARFGDEFKEYKKRVPAVIP